MKAKKIDRRVQRTRALLQDALMDLIREKGYDRITIEEITERANLGRTTFYLHYQSKDELLLAHASHFTEHINFRTLNRSQLLGSEPIPELTTFLESIQAGKTMYLKILHGRDGEIILRGVQAQFRANLIQSLEDVFSGETPKLPLSFLTRYITTAQFGMIDWWLTNRSEITPSRLGGMLQASMAAILKDAYQNT